MGWCAAIFTVRTCAISTASCTATTATGLRAEPPWLSIWMGALNCCTGVRRCRKCLIRRLLTSLPRFLQGLWLHENCPNHRCLGAPGQWGCDHLGGAGSRSAAHWRCRDRGPSRLVSHASLPG